MNTNARRALVAFLAALAVNANSSQEQLINPGFENGLVDWQVRGNVQARSHDPSDLGSGNLAIFQEPGDAGVSQVWQ